MFNRFYPQMMRKIYLYMSIVAAVVYVCQRINITLPSIVNNYLNDLLCMPIVLALIQTIIRLSEKHKHYKIPLYLIFIIAIYYSIYFEWFMPKYNQRYTADSIDVFLYFIGGIGFYVIEQKTT